jgi:cellulose synthase/poly-beta-1,6-N-acetylglucosamine synthase-like glycosyltransferase
VLVILCFTVAGILLLVALHPFIFYPLSLCVLAKIRRRPLAVTAASESGPISYAVCVCAYKEAAVIRTTIESLIALRKTTPDMQILLHVDGNSDGTADIAQEYADRITLVVSPERMGKTYGMNRLIGMTKASVVILTDATVRIDPQAIPNLAKYFRDPQVGCVAGHLRYVNDENATAMVGSFYWRLEERIKELESATGSVMGADGSIYAIRRSLFTPVPEDMIDDMYISLAVLCEGYRIMRAPDVYAYEKSVTDTGEEFRRKIRISCQAFAAHRAMRPNLARLGPLDRYKYISHKLIRWFTAYTLSTAAVLLMIGLGLTLDPLLAAGLTGAGITAAGAALLALGSAVRLRPMTVITDILASFVATAIGVWRASQGHRIRVWEPASSIRKA